MAHRAAGVFNRRVQLGVIRRRFSIARRVRREAGTRAVVVLALARIAARAIHLE
jgi:hypothetical protein